MMHINSVLSILFIFLQKKYLKWKNFEILNGIQDKRQNKYYQCELLYISCTDRATSRF